MLCSVGTSTFTILRDIVPKALKEISYGDLLKKAKEHFSPRPSEIVEWFKFQKQLWKSGERINDFIKDLRQLSEYCNFGNKLNDHLCDQLVFEIQDVKIKKKIVRF